MSVYVLSYDVKDSAKTDNDEFRKRFHRKSIVSLSLGGYIGL